MMTQVWTVKDLAVGVFLQPQFARSLGEAKRAFIAACGASDHSFRMFAKDYVAYHLGEFDDQLGKFQQFDTPQPLMTAHEARDIFDKEYRVNLPLDQMFKAEDISKRLMSAGELAERARNGGAGQG